MSKNHIHLSLSSDEQYSKVAKAGGDKPFWPFIDKHYTLHYTYLQHNDKECYTFVYIQINDIFSTFSHCAMLY